MTDRDRRRGIRSNEFFEPLPVGRQVGLFHLRRSWVVGQHIEELLAERRDPANALARTREVREFEAVNGEIVELLGPHAVADVVMVTGDKGHLKARVFAALRWLILKRNRAGLLGERGPKESKSLVRCHQLR